MMSDGGYLKGGRVIRHFGGKIGILINIVFAVLFLYFGCWCALKSRPGDFANYYTSSRLALEGRLDKVNMYDYYDFQQNVNKYFRGTLASFIPFPPSTILLMVPLAWLSPETARTGVILINVLGVLALIWILRRYTCLPLAVVASLTFLSSLSLWSNLREGQVYILMTLLIAAALLSESKGKHVTAGILLGLILPVKYFTALFVLYFLLKKNLRLVAGALGAAAFVFAAGFVLTGPRMNEFYFGAILPQHLAGHIQDPFAINFQSFNSLLNRLFVYNETLNPDPIIHAAFLGYWLKSFVPLIGLILLILAINATKAFGKAFHDAYWISLLTLFGLTIAPASATYHLVMLILPIVLLVSLGRAEIEPDGADFLGRRLPTLITFYILINVLPFYKLYVLRNDPALQLIAYSRLFMLTLFFLAALPPAIFKGRLFPTLSAGAIALSLVIGFVRSPHQVNADGAKWAALPGLIIRRLSYHGGSLYYLRDTPTGYIEMRNGHPSESLMTDPRQTTKNGVLTAFDSTVDNTYQVFLRSNINGRISEVAKEGSHNMDPVWSSDDSRLYFLSDRDRGFDCTTIYYIPVGELPKP